MPLGPGSIAFVGFNADGNDNLAFVALQDIGPGESITFEDNEWAGSAWGDHNENAFIWTATSAVTAGTVVVLNNVGVTSPAPSASTGTLAFGDSATYGSNHGIGNSGETIYAYAGTRDAPTFITAVSNNGTDPDSGSLAGTGLTYGVNALDLGARDADGDIYAWKGPRDGWADFDALRTALNATPTAANWDAQDASGDQSADGTAPDLPFLATAFSVQPATPTVIFAESFDSFTASGFSPTPAAGQLDSDTWRVAGLSDNASPAYGFTGAAGGDFGRGVIAGAADPTGAGVYSPSADHALILQPTGAEVDGGGYVEARIQNTTGAALSSVEVDFDWSYRNSGDRADPMQLSYSTDGVNFVAAPDAAFTTPGAKDASTAATFSTQAEHVSLSGLNLADQGYLYLRWTHGVSTGSGNRDEVGIDNLVVSRADGSGGPAAATVSIGDATIAEGDDGARQLVFTVTRSDNSGDFTVDYSTADGTATAGSDYVGVSGAGHTLHFTAGGALTQQISITVNGDTAAESSETFTVNLSNLSSASGAAALGDAHGQGVIVDDDGYTRIYAIQGAGLVSQRAGEAVVTQGVVTAVDTNGGAGSRGFYIQDASGDGDASTSDAIFVYAPSGALPTVGHLVQVAGTVQEFTPSGADPGALSTTEISSVTQVTDLGVGPAITPVQIGGPGGLLPPTSDVGQGVSFYEGLEGMLVTVKSPTAVGPTNGFGETFTVVDNDADPTNGLGGTNSLSARGGVLVSGGQPAFGDTDVAGGDFNPERIQIDVDNGILSGFTKPAVDTGARFSDVTGIVNYSFGNYEVLATQAYNVAAPSTLTRETGSLSGDGDHLLVVSYNAENLDPKVESAALVQDHSSSNVDDDLGSGKFDTIASQLFNTLHAPDVVALQEVQDNDGAEITGVTSASLTLQTLVDKLNALAQAAGSTAHYAYVDNPFINNNAAGDANGGQPGGNIRTAFLYRDDRVSLVDGSLRTVAADGSAITTPGGASDQLTNPDNPFYQSRLPLAATFSFNGEEVTVVNNHFTSKGGSAVLMGDDQPPFDAGEVSRAAQAQAVNNFIDGLLSADPNAKVVVAGDLNEFQFEEPLAVLKGQATVANYDVAGDDPITATATYTPGGAAILTDLQDKLPANERYDYVFDGNSETLDHLLVSNNLAGAASFDIVHLNAEFATQTSDHEPLAALLKLGAFTVRTGETVTSPQTLGDGETGSVQAGGTLAVTAAGSANITAVTWTGGSSVLDNEGTISAVAGSGSSRALDTGAIAAGSKLAVVNGADGQILSATNDALRINADIPNGSIVIQNAGVIVSGRFEDGQVTGDKGGQALDFNALTSASVQTRIVNLAGGLIGAANADAIRPGVNAVIENHGVIVAQNGGGDSSSDGIDFQDLGYGSVHNFSGGEITGARHGITAKHALTIDNDAGASILGRLGAGLNLDTPADSTTVVHNAGSITGTAAGSSDGDGVDVDGLVDIDNHGVIEALGVWNGGLSEAISIGGGTIDNFADGVIRSSQRAITVDDSDLGDAFGATTVNNAGLIRGDNGEAIKITGGFADTVVNKGQILGSVDLGGGDDVFEAYAGSSLSGLLDGGAGSDVLNLRGAGAGSVGATSGVETANVYGGDWTLQSEGFQQVVLQAGAQTVRLAASTLADGAFGSTLIGFGADDRIDLQGLGGATSARLGAGNLLTIARADGGPITLQLDPAASYAGKLFTLAGDGAGGALLTVIDDTAPMAKADAASVAENGSVTIDVLHNDVDPDVGDAKTLLSVSETAKGGAVSIVDGKVVYVASADEFDLLKAGQSVTDSFTYTMTDNAGATSSATVTVTVNGVADAAPRNGGNGADAMTGSELEDRLDGGNGDDTLAGAGGADTLSGSNGDDQLNGGAGVDNLDGGNGDDTLDGGAGADTITGANGGDSLLGGGGRDNLSGGNGDDTLNGGADGDVLAGGNGADLFVFEQGFGRDVVSDFKPGEDSIRLAGTGLTSFPQLLGHAAQSGANVVVTVNATDVLQLNNVQLSSLHRGDFVFV